MLKSCKKKSINGLKEIAKLRRIKNRDKLKKEGLITSILKSESSNAERNFMKHFNSNTNDDDNNNTNDNSYDGKIRDKISDIRVILGRLRNTITNNDRKKIKKDLYEIEKQNLSDREKEEIYDHLLELVKTLIKKKNINIMIVMI